VVQLSGAERGLRDCETRPHRFLRPLFFESMPAVRPHGRALFKYRRALCESFDKAQDGLREFPSLLDAGRWRRDLVDAADGVLMVLGPFASTTTVAPFGTRYAKARLPGRNPVRLKKRMKKLLFVCSENRLRSPKAEAVFYEYKEVEARLCAIWDGLLQFSLYYLCQILSGLVHPR
jgi:hypothetical protein